MYVLLLLLHLMAEQGKHKDSVALPNVLVKVIVFMLVIIAV